MHEVSCVGCTIYYGLSAVSLSHLCCLYASYMPSLAMPHLCRLSAVSLPPHVIPASLPNINCHQPIPVKPHAITHSDPQASQDIRYDQSGFPVHIHGIKMCIVYDMLCLLSNPMHVKVVYVCLHISRDRTPLLFA